MARLKWHEGNQRYYEAGLDRGVLYVGSNPGVPWNGLVSVNENSIGGDSRTAYIDGRKFRNYSAFEEFGATIEAFSAPEIFSSCEGNYKARRGLIAAQQRRLKFDLSFRTLIGNAYDGTDYAYKIHLVYNALVSTTSRSNNTLNDSSEASLMSWEVTTLPITGDGIRPTSHFILDSRYTPPLVMRDVENILYGNPDQAARMVHYSELLAIYDAYDDLTIIDHGDGSWSAYGLEHVLQTNSNGEFTIDSEMVTLDADDETFVISDE